MGRRLGYEPLGEPFLGLYWVLLESVSTFELVWYLINKLC